MDALVVPPLSLAARLSGDALAAIVEWLPNKSVCALVLSGDKQLNTKLAHHVRSLKHQINSRNFCWPFYIRGWTALRYLSVNPGLSSDLCSIFYGDLLTLAAHIYESLPTGLEVLILKKWPCTLQTPTRLMWFERAKQALVERSMRAIDSDDDKWINLASLNPISHAWIYILQQQYLPNLKEFSCGLLRARRELSEPLPYWINLQTPLTSLSLHNVTLSVSDVSLCEVFRLLPRTLTSLKLVIDNGDHAYAHGNSFIFSTHDLLNPSVINYKTRLAGALPPHLTRLTLNQSGASHLPSIALAHLSDLLTLKLVISQFARTKRTDLANIVSTRVLSHLPANVRKISLTGFSSFDLNNYLESIPDEHQSLRNLTIERIRFLPRNNDDDDDCYKFLHTITSHAKFRQLELFNPTLCDMFSPSIQTFIAAGDKCVDGMIQMSHLRSVSSDFLLLPVFDRFWEHMSPFLTFDSPMRINQRYPIHIDKHWFRILNNTTTGATPHLIINHLLMNKKIARFLKSTAATTISTSALTSLFKSVKQLTISTLSVENIVETLEQWPGTPEILKLDDGLSISHADASLYVTAHCMRALHSLHIDIDLDTDDLNGWLRLLPETLEVLEISCLPAKEGVKRVGCGILNYIPPRLKSMNMRRGFSVGRETFDAMPPSLTYVNWIEVNSVECGSADMCRWPKKMNSVLVSMEYIHDSSFISKASNYVHSVYDLETWWNNSPYLLNVFISYHIKKDKCIIFDKNSRDVKKSM